MKPMSDGTSPYLQMRNLKTLVGLLRSGSGRELPSFRQRHLSGVCPRPIICPGRECYYSRKADNLAIGPFPPLVLESSAFQIPDSPMIPELRQNHGTCVHLSVRSFADRNARQSPPAAGHHVCPAACPADSSDHLSIYFTLVIVNSGRNPPRSWSGNSWISVIEPELSFVEEFLWRGTHVLRMSDSCSRQWF